MTKQQEQDVAWLRQLLRTYPGVIVKRSTPRHGDFWWLGALDAWFYSREGSFDDVRKRLARLARLGYLEKDAAWDGFIVLEGALAIVSEVLLETS